jgi:hypothetical protein
MDETLTFFNDSGTVFRTIDIDGSGSIKYFLDDDSVSVFSVDLNGDFNRILLTTNMHFHSVDRDSHYDQPHLSFENLPKISVYKVSMIGSTGDIYRDYLAYGAEPEPTPRKRLRFYTKKDDEYIPNSFRGNYVIEELTEEEAEEHRQVTGEGRYY